MPICCRFLPKGISFGAAGFFNELGEAHTKIAELNQRLKEDLEALQQIDATP